MATQAEVEEELTTEFAAVKIQDKRIVTCNPIEKSPYYKEFVTIGVSLSDPALVKSGLQALEKDILQVLEDNIAKDGNGNKSDGLQLALDHFTNRAKQFAKFTAHEYPAMNSPLPEQKLNYPEDNDPRFSKLLSTALKKTESNAGFADEVDYIFSGLDSTAFLQNLRTKRPFKDYGATPGRDHLEVRIGMPFTAVGLKSPWWRSDHFGVLMWQVV